jgi:hypothetical protein
VTDEEIQEAFMLLGLQTADARRRFEQFRAEEACRPTDKFLVTTDRTDSDTEQEAPDA